MVKFFEKNKLRIEGISFFDKSDLKKHQKLRNHYSSVCHRELGKKLDLFSEIEEGFWVWHTRGVQLKENVINFWKKFKRGCRV